MRIAVLTIKISILNAYFWNTNYLKVLSAKIVSKIGYKMKMYPKMYPKLKKMDTKMDTKDNVSKIGYIKI